MALVEVSQANGRVPVTIFRLLQRIHLGNFAELEKTTQAAYNDGMRNLVIDLGGSEALTSIGLRALVVIHKILAGDEKTGFLKVAGASDMIVEIMQVTGISQFIDTYDTVEEAVASF